MMLNAESPEIKKRAEQKTKDLEIQKKDLQAELVKINKAQTLKSRTIEQIMGNLLYIFGIDDFGIERRKRLINMLVSCVIVTDAETLVTIDDDGSLDKMDGKEWKEWYDEIEAEWNEILDYNEDTDDNSNGGVRISNTTLRQVRRIRTLFRFRRFLYIRIII